VQSRLDHARYPGLILLTADLEVPTRSEMIGCGGNRIAGLCFLGYSMGVRSYEMILTSEPKDLLMAKETTWRAAASLAGDHQRSSFLSGWMTLFALCSHSVPEAVM
jgi:hypothetical protein